MRRLRRPIAALGLALATTCNGHPPTPDVQPGRVVVVLVDRSRSTAQPAIRRLFAQTFDSVAAKLGPGDVVLAGWISDQSTAELTLPLKVALPSITTTSRNPRRRRSDSLVVDSLVRAKRDSVIVEFRRLVTQDSAFSGATDILGSLELANRTFRLHPGYGKVTILMSDMVEESPRLNLRHADLSAARIDRIIAELRTQDRLPELAGVAVCVVGAGLRDSERSRAIESFWKALFQVAGADLRDYGTALIKLAC